MKFLRKLKLSASNNGVSTGLWWLRTSGEKLHSYSPVDGKLIGTVIGADAKAYEDVIKKAKVEQDNRILVNKIEAIFEHGHHLSLKKEIKRHADKFVMATSSTNRKPDLYEINKENQSMLSRLNSQASPYNHKKYIKER